MKTAVDTKRFAFTSLFVALVLIIGLVPFLGFIPLFAFNLVTVHIPVIVGAVFLGPKIGALLGFFFGVTSLLNATFFRPNPIESPLFSPFFTGGVFPGSVWSLVICFVPRILLGLVAGLLFSLLKKTQLPRPISLAATGIIASLMHTVLVLTGVYLFFGYVFAQANDIPYNTLITVLTATLTTNGLLEAALAAFLSVGVGTALLNWARFDRR